jgi:predicted nuclease with TOPRIM domain
MSECPYCGSAKCCDHNLSLSKRIGSLCDEKDYLKKRIVELYSELEADNKTIAELEADKAILQKDIAFLQSCVNSGERASISDRPSKQPDSGGE